MNLRDHDQPCEHDFRVFHLVLDNGGRFVRDCPGGREVTPQSIAWCGTHQNSWPSCPHAADPNDTPCRKVDAWLIVDAALGGSDES